MLDKIDDLCAERDKLKKDQPGPTKGKVLGGTSVVTELKWYDPKNDPPPWIKGAG
jgi:hypothetical protein